MFEDFVSFLVTVSMFLVEGGTTEVAVGGGTIIEDRVVVVAVEEETTTEDGVKVDTGGVAFSFRFVVFEVINFILLLPLVMLKKYITYLLIVSFFSQSKMRTSYLEV